MTFLSASDDFMLRTLARIPGRWRKLQYVASLREADGSYRHWGLARTYGESAAGRAIQEVHRELFLQLLRAPVRDLWDEARETLQQDPASAATFVAELEASAERLTPPDFGGGSARHFNSVLEALAALARRGSSRPGASPLPLPGR